MFSRHPTRLAGLSLTKHYGGGPHLFVTLPRLRFYIFATFLAVLVRLGTC